jgi:hypothetical protein
MHIKIVKIVETEETRMASGSNLMLNDRINHYD